MFRTSKSLIIWAALLLLSLQNCRVNSDVILSEVNKSCPCLPRHICPRTLGSSPVDEIYLGVVLTCAQENYVRCCGVSIERVVGENKITTKMTVIEEEGEADPMAPDHTTTMSPLTNDNLELTTNSSELIATAMTPMNSQQMNDILDIYSNANMEEVNPTYRTIIDMAPVMLVYAMSAPSHYEPLKSIKMHGSDALTTEKPVEVESSEVENGTEEVTDQNTDTSVEPIEIELKTEPSHFIEPIAFEVETTTRDTDLSQITEETTEFPPIDLNFIEPKSSKLDETEINAKELTENPTTVSEILSTQAATEISFTEAATESTEAASETVTTGTPSEISPIEAVSEILVTEIAPENVTTEVAVESLTTEKSIENEEIKNIDENETITENLIEIETTTQKLANNEIITENLAAAENVTEIMTSTEKLMENETTENSFEKMDVFETTTMPPLSSKPNELKPLALMTELMTIDNATEANVITTTVVTADEIVPEILSITEAGEQTDVSGNKRHNSSIQRTSSSITSEPIVPSSTPRLIPSFKDKLDTYRKNQANKNSSSEEISRKSVNATEVKALKPNNPETNKLMHEQHEGTIMAVYSSLSSIIKQSANKRPTFKRTTSWRELIEHSMGLHKPTFGSYRSNLAKTSLNESIPVTTTEKLETTTQIDKSKRKYSRRLPASNSNKFKTTTTTTTITTTPTTATAATELLVESTTARQRYYNRRKLPTKPSKNESSTVGYAAKTTITPTNERFQHKENNAQASLEKRKKLFATRQRGSGWSKIEKTTDLTTTTSTTEIPTKTPILQRAQQHRFKLKTNRSNQYTLQINGSDST
ncbi:probable serine/threonine-protein kinase dyrk2 [Contarinia nasturtii]|uniref:probable serine/threonine-protein kinase dyrk2 n=1 Tax=Contarinia nasturtii TaxID=265458 RepID=UPI0012D4377E|nr:probable serine/threonine-protein kinase dyrk2 [Contarinia nasturtii]